MPTNAHKCTEFDFNYAVHIYIYIYIIQRIQMIPTPNYQFKVVLVGESSVGKSSILSRFVDDHFSQSLLSTIGVDFKFRKIRINSDEVKLQIWDTAGQETFRSIVSAYYNSSDAIIIVYDITSYRSIQSVKDYWLAEVSNNNKNDAGIFLIGNKLDEAPTKRQVEAFSIESVLQSNHIDKHFEVSAKTGENIETAFVQICKILINKRKQNPGSRVNPAQQTAGKNISESTKLENNNSPSYQPNKCCIK